MRKTVLLLTIVGAMLALTASAAFAVAKEGGNGDDTLRGTSGRDALAGGPGDDVLRGLGGRDALAGGSGADDLFGGSGRDALSGGRGNDFIDDGNDGVADAIVCGPGIDTVRADGVDELEDCERVTRR